jgi:hypothetical protein
MKAECRARFAQKLEDILPYLGHVVFGMEAKGGFPPLRLEGFDSGKIRIGKKLQSQRSQFGGEVFEIINLKFADDEISRASVTPDDSLALVIE